MDFDVGRGDDDCSDDSNRGSDIDGDSSNNNCAESVMLSAGSIESIILSSPSLKS